MPKQKQLNPTFEEFMGDKKPLNILKVTF